MENISNGGAICLTVLFSILIVYILYSIVKAIIWVKKENKYTKEYNLIHKNAENERDKFIKYINTQDILTNTNSYSQLVFKINHVFDKEFEYKICEDSENKLERFKDGYNALIFVKNELINKVEEIKASISYNINHWYTEGDNLPEFFVLENIFNGDKTYCHSTNLHFNNDSKDIIGHIFDHIHDKCYLISISAKDYKILPMNKKEFYNKYLLSRINIMNFVDFRKKNEYEKYLIEEFNKNYKNE